MLHSHRMLEGFVCCRCKRPTCLGLGDHIDHRITVFYSCLFFQDQCAVQMFAALSGQIHPRFLRSLINSAEDHLRQLRAGISTDRSSSHLTGGAAYYKQFSQLQLSFLQDLPGCGICLFCNDCHIFCHDEYLPDFLVIAIFSAFSGRQTALYSYSRQFSNTNIIKKTIFAMVNHPKYFFFSPGICLATCL